MERGQPCPRAFWLDLDFARTKLSALLHPLFLEYTLATPSAGMVAMVRSLLPRPKAAWKFCAGVAVTTAVPLLK